MNGRRAWLQDSPEQCRQGLLRLRAALSAADLHPTTVSLLPDRSSRILGLAAAELLGLPAVPFESARTDTVVVAYDLSEVDAELLSALHERTAGQVLHEHASCWTHTPPVTPDRAALLLRSVVPPWGSHLQRGENGEAEQAAEDSRPAEEIGAVIVRADAAEHDDDGEAPEDHERPSPPSAVQWPPTGSGATARGSRRAARCPAPGSCDATAGAAGPGRSAWPHPYPWGHTGTTGHAWASSGGSLAGMK